MNEFTHMKWQFCLIIRLKNNVLLEQINSSRPIALVCYLDYLPFASLTFGLSFELYDLRQILPLKCIYSPPQLQKTARRQSHC